jgi:hypothetical protein
MRPISTDTAEQHGRTSTSPSSARSASRSFSRFPSGARRGRWGPSSSSGASPRSPTRRRAADRAGRAHRRGHPPRRARRRSARAAGEARGRRHEKGDAHRPAAHRGARAGGRRRRCATPDAARAESTALGQAASSHVRRRAAPRGRLRRGRQGHPRPRGAGAQTHRPGRDASFLGTYAEILDDARFRERVNELAATGMGVARALSQVARDVTRTAAAVTRDPYLEERARDVEDLCDALTMLAESDKRRRSPARPSSSATPSPCSISSSAPARIPAGIALSERASGPALRALLKLINVPAVVDVRGSSGGRPTGTSPSSTATTACSSSTPARRDGKPAPREYRRSDTPTRERRHVIETPGCRPKLLEHPRRVVSRWDAEPRDRARPTKTPPPPATLSERRRRTATASASPTSTGRWLSSR